MSDDDIRSDYAIAAARAAAQLTTQLELAETSLGTRSGRDIVRGIAERSELQDRLSEQVAETVGSPNARAAAQTLGFVPLDAALRWSRLDAKEFRKLTDPSEIEDAGIAMARSAAGSASYKLGLETLAPDVLARVAAVEKGVDQRSMAKEERKAREAEPLSQAERLDYESSRIPMLNEEARRSKEEAGLVPNIIEAVKIRERSRAGNVVESDEVMTARLPDQRSVIPPEVEQRYIRKENKFYVRDLPDVVAFEDKGNKLETRSSNEQIAESMVQVARARGWEEINVRGTEAFKKEVWLEAAANGMHVRGYTPTEQDKESLAKRSPRQADRLENEQHLVSGREEPTKQQEKTPPTRSEAFLNMNPVQGSTMYPELVGAYALASAIDKQTVAAGFSPEQREIAAARARRNIARSIDRGELPRMEINEEIEVRREPVRESSQGLSR